MKVAPGPIVHGALLLAGLVAAYQLRASDPAATAAHREVALWEEPPGSVVTVRMDAGERTLELSRRSDTHGAYLWGRSTTFRSGALQSVPGDPAAPVDVDEYLVGAAGQVLFEALAAPRAVRDLGRLDDELAKAYKLDHPTITLIVELRSITRRLRVGDRTMGVRYVLDPETRHGYAVSADLLAPLERDAALQDYRLHAFTAEAVAGATLTGASKEITVVRLRGESRGADAWADAARPDEPDQTFANVMRRLDTLSVGEYAATTTPEGLRRIARIEYRGARGEALGFAELFERAGDAAQPAQFLFRTEHTRVLVKVLRGPAEQVTRDLQDILR